jgi:hypothetical protein
MSNQQKQAHCKTCNKKTLHVKTEPRRSGCVGHLLLTVLTCGLWFPIFIFLYGLEEWGALLAPWHCQVCGRKK